MEWLTHIGAFLSGTAVGACGQYLADKYTDKRRKAESASILRERFKRAEKEAPVLIAEMRDDCRKSQFRGCREFIVLQNSRIMFNSDSLLFRYLREEHPAIDGHMIMLQTLEFIHPVESNVPRYLLSEDFVELLRDTTLD